MRQHILRLCEAREYHVTCCARPRQSYALREAEEIQIAPIKSALSYATALHEVGHLEGRHQNSKRVMVRERWAWQWARANALVWTPAMERQAQEGLAWYAPRSAKIDRQWRPFRPPGAAPKAAEGVACLPR